MNKPPCFLPSRATDAHKGTFGRVILVGGSRGMAGSISLSAIAALRCGSGLVSAAIPDRCLETVAAFHPALMTVPLEDDSRGRFSLQAAEQLAPRLRQVDAVGCGPGMTTETGSLRLVERLLQTVGVPRVMDADAINCMSLLNWPQSRHEAATGSTSMILTPHPGELARLTGVEPAKREHQIAAAEHLSDQTGAIVVIKGGPTVVVGRAENGETTRWTNSTGNPGMATGGSGDVLTGIITSLLGQGLSSWNSARLGVWIHGRAGDLAAARCGQIGMTAKEILDELPAANAEAITPDTC